MSQEKQAAAQAAYAKIHQEIIQPIFWETFRKSAGENLMPKTEEEADKILKIAGAWLADRAANPVRPAKPAIKSAIDIAFEWVTKAAEAQNDNPLYATSSILDQVMADSNYVEAAGTVLDALQSA
jgi:hypothetical protein